MDDEEVRIETTAISDGGWNIRSLLRAIAGCVVVLVLITGGVVAGRNTIASPSAASGKPPKLGQSFSGTPWSPSNLPFAQQIVFAPSAPQTAYICTTPPTGAIKVGFALQRGKGPLSWSYLATPAYGTQCALSIDPNDAHDLFLIAKQSALGGENVYALWRTHDGGQHWEPWEVPQRAPGIPTAIRWYRAAWSGATFFIAALVDVQDVPTMRLASSIANAPLAWVNEAGISAGNPVGGGINGLFGTPTTLYVTFSGHGDCLDPCFWIMGTGDGGRSWSRPPLSYNGIPVTIVGALHGGQWLAGQIFDPIAHVPILLVTTSNLDWQALPPLGLRDWQLLADPQVCPDQTVYVMVKHASRDVLLPGDGIYRLQQGTTHWTAIAAPPPALLMGNDAFTVSCDGDGHPTALWAPASDSTTSLSTHTP